MMKKMMTWCLLLMLILSSIGICSAAAQADDMIAAAELLRERGIMQGDASGSLRLDKSLSRAELAVLLTRLHGGEDTDPNIYTWACYFTDVPAWAKPYVGYCVAALLMRGYDSTRFGARDSVNPAAACSVILRAYQLGREGTDWTYKSAAAYASKLGLVNGAALSSPTFSRGDMALLICKAIQKQSGAELPAHSESSPHVDDASGAYTISTDHWSREDFSRQANPAVFGGIYDRALYNTLRQAVVDAGTGRERAYTMVAPGDYGTVKRLVGRMDGVMRYEHRVPSDFRNYYEYPNYFAVVPEMPESYVAPLRYIQPVIAEAKRLTTDRARVEYLNNYLGSRLDYRAGTSAGMAQIFSDHDPGLTGACGSYAVAFNFLCSAADIPCILVSSKDHTWNLVYADGQWLHVDVAANDAAGRNYILLTGTNPNSTDLAPEATNFLKEVLVPGSSK